MSMTREKVDAIRVDLEDWGGTGTKASEVVDAFRWYADREETLVALLKDALRYVAATSMDGRLVQEIREAIK